MKGFRYGSDQGSFYILPGNDGWEATFGNDSLGEFQSPEHAVDYLARGVNCPTLEEVDTSTLDIPGLPLRPVDSRHPGYRHKPRRAR